MIVCLRKAPNIVSGVALLTFFFLRPECVSTETTMPRAMPFNSFQSKALVFLKPFFPHMSLLKQMAGKPRALEKDMEEEKKKKKKRRILRALEEVQRSCSGERKCVIKFTGSAEQVITELIKQEFLTQ